MFAGFLMYNKICYPKLFVNNFIQNAQFCLLFALFHISDQAKNGIDVQGLKR